MLTEEQIKYICENYYIKSASQISKDTGCHIYDVYHTWTKYSLRGKSKHTYSHNQDYFENIDTIDKAYFLGFIAADGCIFDYGIKTCQNLLQLVVNKRDIEVIEKFKKYINAENPINYIRENNFAVLSLISDKLYRDLNKLGLHPNKTYGNTIVNLPDKYMRHFIRGYFDGDGSIVYKKDGSVNTNITIYGFENNMIQIMNHLENHNIYSKFSEDKRIVNNQKFGRIVLTNRNNRYAFLKYLYDGCEDLYLSRKYEVAKSYMDTIEADISVVAREVITYFKYAVMFDK